MPDGSDPAGDVPDRAAPPAGNSADPMSDARAWAQREAPEHFAGLWLEAAAEAPVIAFTDDIAGYAEEVRDRFGDEWWVVGATFSEVELRELQERIVDSEMAANDWTVPHPGMVTTAGVRGPVNRVSLTVLKPDGERLAELGERYGSDAICVEVETMVDEDDAQPAPWEPARDADLSPDVTSVDVLINEVGCASGQPADGRIATPEIAYEDESVVVTIRVIPRPGPQNCPGNPDTEYTLELDEPLGERQLLDGAHNPPAEPDLERGPPGWPRDPGDVDGAHDPPAESDLERDPPDVLGEPGDADGAHDPPAESDLERDPPDVLGEPGDAG